MEETQKIIQNIIFNVSNAIKNKNSSTFLSSHKLIFAKHQKFTEDVYRRVGKDDRHETTQRTTFSFENLNENSISRELSTKIQKSLEALEDFETSSSQYYGGNSNTSSSNEILLEKSRLINHQLDKYNSAELLSENRINRILFYYLQDLNKEDYLMEIPSKYVQSWYIYKTSIKVLNYLLFSEKSKDIYYQDLIINKDDFWNEFLDYTKSKFNASILNHLDKIYIDNKVIIDDFIIQKIDELKFEKVVKELLVSTIEEINILKIGVIVNKYHKYYI